MERIQMQMEHEDNANEYKEIEVKNADEIYICWRRIRRN